VGEEGRSVLGDEIVGVVEEALPEAGRPGGTGAAPVDAEHLEPGGGEDVRQGMRGVEVEVDVVGGESVTEQHRLDEAADGRTAAVNGEARPVRVGTHSSSGRGLRSR
jgi:hypothetical protein